MTDQISTRRFLMRLNYLLHPLKIDEDKSVYFSAADQVKRFYHYRGQLNGPFGKAHVLLCMSFLCDYLQVGENEVIEIQIENFRFLEAESVEFKENHPVIFLLTLLVDNQFSVNQKVPGSDLIFEDFLIINEEFLARNLLKYFLSTYVEANSEIFAPEILFEEFLGALSERKQHQEIIELKFTNLLLGFFELMDWINRVVEFVHNRLRNRLLIDCVLNYYRVEISMCRHIKDVILRYFVLLDRLPLITMEDLSSDKLFIDGVIDRTKAEINISTANFFWLIGQDSDTFLSAFIKPLDLSKYWGPMSLTLTETDAVISN